MPIERMFETRGISVMRGSAKVLVKVMLFQLRVCGYPEGDATPNSFPDSKGFLLGLSKEVSLFLDFLGKMVKTNKMFS